MSTKLLLSPSECAQALGVSRNTVYDLLQGELSSFLIGTRRKIPVSEVEQYIARQIEAQGAGHPQRQKTRHAMQKSEFVANSALQRKAKG